MDTICHWSTYCG